MKALWDVNTTNADAQAVWENNGIELVGAWPVGRLVMGAKEECATSTTSARSAGA